MTNPYEHSTVDSNGQPTEYAVVFQALRGATLGLKIALRAGVPVVLYIKIAGSFTGEFPLSTELNWQAEDLFEQGFFLYLSGLGA